MVCNDRFYKAQDSVLNFYASMDDINNSMFPVHPRVATWYAPNLLNDLSKMAAVGEVFNGGKGLSRNESGARAVGAFLLFFCERE